MTIISFGASVLDEPGIKHGVFDDVRIRFKDCLYAWNIAMMLFCSPEAWRISKEPVSRDSVETA